MIAPEHRSVVGARSAATLEASATRTALDVMQADPSLIPSDATIEGAWQLALEKTSAAYLVGTHERLFGPVLHQRLEDSMRAGKADDPVASIVDGSRVHAHGDQPLDIVLERFAQSGGLLPIMSRAHIHRLEGVMTVDNLLRFGQSQPGKSQA